MESYNVFGNPLPESRIQRAQRAFRKYARKFSFDPTWRPELLAEASGSQFDTFGIRNLVDGHAQAIAASQPSKRNGPQDLSATFNGAENLEPVSANKGLVLGTVRMGFGHYRIALALASAARALGFTPYWLDFLAFPDSTASRVISHLERLYNFGSRLSQKSKIFNRLFWEKFTSETARKLSTAVRNAEVSRLFAPLAAALPKDIPFISTHPWTGLAARDAGLQRIVTAIPDNFPVAFHLVENTIHVVQTHSSYFGYRMLRGMGERHENLRPMPDDQIRWVGQFVDPEIVEGIPSDCDARMRRIRDRRPRRVLLTMGGAGAQVSRFLEIARFCRARIQHARTTLFINMGDHSGRWNELRKALEADRIPYVLHSDWKETRGFVEFANTNDVEGLHVFLHSDIFAAVYSTNLLMRVSDLLVTKPGELSFYPVPKLFIQRVGRHEAWGAIHGAEIGDGTMETDSIESMLQTLGTILDEDDLLTMYCSAILENKAAGLYDGAYRAVQIAVGSATGQAWSGAPNIA